MKKLNLRELRVPIILAAVVLLAVLILTITVSGHRSRSDRAAVEAGITYLEAQEARDPAQVDEILRLRLGTHKGEPNYKKFAEKLDER